MKDSELFFELIRVAIGRQERLSRTPSAEEWQMLYGMAEKQTLVGVCFAGVRKSLTPAPIPAVAPTRSLSPKGEGSSLYYQWLAMAAQIQEKNKMLDERTVVCQRRVMEAGFESLVLKGQGIAQQYAGGLKDLRQPGDIDIWLRGSRKEIMQWVNSVAPTKEVTWLHAQLKVFADTEVEVHFAPTYMRTPFYNRRVRKWFEQTGWGGCSEVALEKGTIRVPTAEFNVVFVLLHIFRHLFGEGIGLRQVMDYYFVCASLNDKGEMRNEKLLRSFGLYRFASAMMWILGHVFGLEKERMIAEPDEKLGRMILSDIMRSGNFGHHDERKRSDETRLQRFVRVNRDDVRYMRYFPSEVLMTPLFRLWHFCWKKMKGYE